MDFFTIFRFKYSGMENTIKKKDGFQGQKAIVIPKQVLSSRCVKNTVINPLYITDIGYYPKAKFHYMERKNGAEQHILIYCHDGKGRVTIGKNEFKIQADDFITIPIKTPHSYSADDNEPWSIFWVHFKGTVSAKLVSSLEKKNRLRGFIKFKDESIRLFNEIYDQLERGYSSSNLMYTNMSVWRFFTTFLFNDKFDSSGKLSNKDSIDQVIDYLSNHVDKVLSLDEMAKEVNLSPSHFSFLFKKKTGYSPIEYFNHLKVQKACQFLLFTKLRIKEISQELGIEDQYYFSRMFTKVMGLAPNDYREKRVH